MIAPINSVVFGHAGHRCIKNSAAGLSRFDTVKRWVRLVHMLGKCWEMVVHVHSLVTVSDKSANSWIISTSYDMPNW